MSGNRQASDVIERIRARTMYANFVATRKAVQEGCNTTAKWESGSGDLFTESSKTTLVVGARLTTAEERDAVLAQTCPAPASAPVYTTYYDAFTTVGTTTWTAPATIQGSITYWIVGGGGGGGGAHDQRGNGGGGGGAAITGTYPVVAGTTYDIVVGEGGAGGTGQGRQSPAGPDGGQTDGMDGTDSSFDRTSGGPFAAGGGKGLIGEPARQGGSGGGAITTGGGGGGGGGRGGGGGGAGGNGTDGALGFGIAVGIGGAGISFTIPGYNGGNPQTYGAGGNGGANPFTGFTVGADGLANRGNGGGGGSAASFSPPHIGGLRKMGGDGGSGLVVIQYSA